MITLYALAAAVGIGVLWLGTNIKVIKQFERGVVFRFGRVQSGLRGPGLTMLIPIADRLERVNMQIITMPVPSQDGITRDNVTVRVDAVIYFKVSDPVRAAVDVQDYVSAIGQVAQTSLRSIIGKSNLDDLLSNRERLNQGLELMIDSPALGWGVQIDRVEIKDVVLPDSMKRSIARQAEAERERRARVITAEGELQASEKLAQAAEVMAEHPAALQLRLLETVVEVAAEKNSTLVLPFPVELLRFLERATPQAAEQPDTAVGTDAGAASSASKTTTVRYERARPGELIDMDVKKIGRIPDGGGWKAHGRAAGDTYAHKVAGTGFDYVHSAVDDHSRLAYSEILPDEKGPTCAAFLGRAAAYFTACGVTTIERVITDNHFSYRRSAAVAAAITSLGAVHKYIRPHCPWQNGKVERYNRTLQTERAYRQVFSTNDARSAALAPWLEHYNNQRRHSALGGQPRSADCQQRGKARR